MRRYSSKPSRVVPSARYHVGPGHDCGVGPGDGVGVGVGLGVGCVVVVVVVLEAGRVVVVVVVVLLVVVGTGAGTTTLSGVEAHGEWKASPTNEAVSSYVPAASASEVVASPFAAVAAAPETVPPLPGRAEKTMVFPPAGPGVTSNSPKCAW